MSDNNCAELLQQEVETLSAIYGDDDVSFQKGFITLSGKVIPSQVSVKIPDPNGEEHYAYCPIVVSFLIPNTYPLQFDQDIRCTFEYDTITNPANPRVEVMSNWLSEENADEAQIELQKLYQKEQREILFDYVEWLREFLPFPSPTNTSISANNDDLTNTNDTESTLTSEKATPTDKAGYRWEEEWKKHGIIVGEPLIDRKNIFRAQAIHVTSQEDVQNALKVLYLNPKIQEATHNMYAYRIDRGDNLPIIADYNDDGEDCAGSRMALLLDMTKSKNVLVVVSRWFSGIKLGPDRFRHINAVSLSILEQNNFVDPNRHDKRKKSKK